MDYKDFLDHLVAIEKINAWERAAASRAGRRGAAQRAKSRGRR